MVKLLDLQINLVMASLAIGAIVQPDYIAR